MASSLHPPVPPPKSPSPSPGPEKNLNSRASMGPSSRGVSQGISSPRPGGMMSGRPVSELLSTGNNMQTPEAEAIDQWFENLQNYEATLEEMAAASLDANFKEELSAIEQWFKVLSEAERTAALYSLLQHSTQVQIRFFITVLQQMARSDPMTALLSPAMGGSMQSQMEAKLAALNLKSPGLKPSGMPSSPAQRNFSAPANRQSLALESSSANNFLSPDSAAVPGTAGLDAASTLAQQRARLKASAANAAHRISAPVASGGGDGRAAWGSQLGQVAELNSPGVDGLSRPKSTEFSGTVKSPRFGLGGTDSVLSPMHGDSWASQVNTPLIPMFKDRNPQNIDSTTSKLNEWSSPGNSRVPLMDDASKFRRTAKTSEGGRMYDDDGNVLQGSGLPQGVQQQRRNVSAPGPAGSWGQNRTSPALSNATGSNRFNNTEDQAPGAGINGLGVGGFNMGLGSPGLMGAGMAPLNPIQLNMLAQMSAMGMVPDQLMAAQMGFNQPNWMALQAQMQAANMNQNRSRSNMGRSTAGTARSSNNGRSDSGKTNDEEVDPNLLQDIPGWLRSLRLHKYTPNFEGMKWQDMCVMDEAALEAKGVAALGARRKMLKTFELVRAKMGIPDPEGSVKQAEGSNSPTPSAATAPTSA